MIGSVPLWLRGLDRWPRLVVAFLAGLVAALSMPPFLAWPVLLLCFTIFVWLLDGIAMQPGSRLGRAASALALGWAFGFGYFIASLYWIGAAFLVEAEVYAWMLPLAVIALPAGLALYWGGAAVLAVLLWRPGIRRILVLAVFFSTAEWLRGHLFTGFPWNALGYAAEGVPGLDQLAAFVGIWGLTILVVLLAATPACLADRAREPAASVTVALILAAGALLAVLGQVRVPADPSPVVPGVALRIVQPNVPQSDKWRYDNAAAIFERLLRLSDQGPVAKAARRVVVWPESSVPFLIDEHPAALAHLAATLPGDATLVMGSLRRSTPGDARADVFNSVFAIVGGRIVAVYDKWHLVPYGEYLPLERWLAPLGLRRLVTIPGSFASGTGPRTLAIPGLPAFSPLVCYEVIFPGAVRDADDRPDWLLNVTNDGWFGDTSGPHQHLSQARLRAIEEGLPLVRAANTGISAVIDPYGRVVASLPLGAEGSLDGELPRAIAPTLYGRFGDAIFGLFLIVAAALGLWPPGLRGPLAKVVKSREKFASIEEQKL
ncbi:MAG TPA: apolipoprotein N-acyltransferase [Aestuariivirgaceae bacterium]|nr:apolipoprotein N-acyltransferase [Aestuariivirgaceae bacterium]